MFGRPPMRACESRPGEAANADLRTREYLTIREVEKFIAIQARRSVLYGHRDATLILMPSGMGCAPARSPLAAR
jgi:hypothetical protein